MFHGAASAGSEKFILAAESAGIRITRFAHVDDLSASGTGSNQVPVFLSGPDAVRGFFRDRRDRHGAAVIAIALDGEVDVCHYLDAGADDAVRPPVEGREILSRLHAIGRRIAGAATAEICAGPLRVPLGEGPATFAGTALRLSGTERQVLRILAVNHPRRVARLSIYDMLYAMEEDPPQPKVVDVHVSNLRRKLMAADPRGRNFIEAEAGVGYGLAAIA